MKLVTSTLKPHRIWQIGNRAHPRAKGPVVAFDISVLVLYIKQWGQNIRFHRQTDRLWCTDRDEKGGVAVGNGRGKVCADTGIKDNSTRTAESEDMDLYDAILLLERLPPELRELVAKFCPDSMVWRYGVTLQGRRASLGWFYRKG